jgi:NTE family protein
MKPKIALVLNGGGARGSYQAGVVRAIYEIVKKDQLLFDIVTGNSAGAINAIFLASSARDWGEASQYLYDVWRKITPDDVFDLSHYTIKSIGQEWLSGSLFKSEKDGAIINSLFNTSPLKNYLEREIEFEEIHHLIEDNLLTGVSLSTTNYYSGSNIIFYDGASSINDWTKLDRISVRSRLKIEHVMASCAIPLFFPPIKIGESFYGDGSIRQVTPLSPSIHLGADKIIAIGVRHRRETETIKEIISKKSFNPEMSQIIGVILNAIFLDSLESDIEHLKKTNELVKNCPSSKLRDIPILTMEPSVQLGSLTHQMEKKLPLMFRYLLKSVGVSQHAGMDVLSYLAFDSSYTKIVSHLGYTDTWARKDEILSFFD